MTHKYIVTGLDCPNCAKKLSAELGKKTGIDDVKLNFLSEELTVVSDLSASDLDAVVIPAGPAFERGVVIKRK